MSDIFHLAKSRATAIWLLLVLATAASWWLGVHSVPGLEKHGGAVGATVMAIALVKVRFVAMDFMEVRGAPIALRIILELYIITVLTMLVTLLLAS